jgi:TonB family protein
VLAPEDESRALDALRFSLASDIVELVVLTGDDGFFQTLREAVGSARRLWHVRSADKVSDLLVAGGVGILVLDVQALHETALVFVTHIKRQFPDLVVVAAGNREDETALAHLISVGVVYRFIHKPLSPGRARLFADAAVKKYDEQRKRSGGSVAAIAAPANRRLLVGAAACGALCVAIGLIWLVRHAGPRQGSSPAAISDTATPGAAAAVGAPGAAVPGAAMPSAAMPQESPQLTRAAQALAANRLTEPSGDNALELYQQELAHNPGDADARAGLAEVHERLLARAENALLEERLDEASAAIETARKAGVEPGRVGFLTAQLAKAREQRKAPPSAARGNDAAADGRAAPDPASEAAALAVKRMDEGRLIEPEKDSARFYVQEALSADPNNGAAQQAEQALALKLLSEVRSAIDRRDFAHASSALEAANGIASQANIDNLQHLLLAARREADAVAQAQLLKSAEQRLSEDRLIEPANDNAKYYLLTLRGLDPTNAGLAPLTQDFGARLIAKARRALALKQYDAARSWLDEATAVGYASPDAAATASDLQTALTKEAFLTNVASASELDLVKSVQPVYPKKAEQSGIEGWVDIEFTVAESGQVKDIAVRNASPPGVFDQAAIGALAQWRYKPVIKDTKPTPQRARIRIRFALAR